MKQSRLIKTSLFLFLIFLGKVTALDLKEGWNLIGSNQGGIDIETAIPNAKVVWLYENNTWKLCSPNGEYTQEMITDSGYKTFSTVEAGNGFWVKLDNEDTIDLNGTFSLDTSISVSKGWNLVALKTIDEKDLEFYLNDTNISTIWKYAQNQWSVYSSSTAITTVFNQNSIQRIETLKPYEGFWINAAADLKVDFSIPEFLRIKKTSDTLAEMWDISFDILPDQDIDNFNIGLQMIKLSSGTIGNFVLEGVTIKNNAVTKIDTIYMFAKKTTGLMTYNQYSGSDEKMKNVLTLVDGKLSFNLASIIEQQSLSDQSSLMQEAEYQVSILASKLNLKSSYLVDKLSLQVIYNKIIDFNSDSQVIKGNIKIIK